MKTTDPGFSSASTIPFAFIRSFAVDLNSYPPRQIRRVSSTRDPIRADKHAAAHPIATVLSDPLTILVPIIVPIIVDLTADWFQRDPDLIPLLLDRSFGCHVPE